MGASHHHHTPKKKVTFRPRPEGMRWSQPGREEGRAKSCHNYGQTDARRCKPHLTGRSDSFEPLLLDIALLPHSAN